MTYRASGTFTVEPFNLDMQRYHAEERPSGYFVHHEPGDFATVNIGPCSFFLSREQIVSLAATCKKVVEQWPNREAESDGSRDLPPSTVGAAVFPSETVHASD